jgi:hypothetical protein
VTRFTSNTTGAPDIAMEFDNVLRSGSLVQPVDVLGNKREIVKPILPASNLVMGRIGLQTTQHVAPVIKPLPEGRQVALEHLC